MTKLTKEDLENLVAAYDNEGDVTEYGTYSEKLPQIKKEFPLLVECVERIEDAEQGVSAMVALIEKVARRMPDD